MIIIFITRCFDISSEVLHADTVNYDVLNIKLLLHKKIFIITDFFFFK